MLPKCRLFVLRLPLWSVTFETFSGKMPAAPSKPSVIEHKKNTYIICDAPNDENVRSYLTVRSLFKSKLPAFDANSFLCRNCKLWMSSTLCVYVIQHMMHLCSKVPELPFMYAEWWGHCCRWASGDDTTNRFLVCRICHFQMGSHLQQMLSTLGCLPPRHPIRNLV